MSRADRRLQRHVDAILKDRRPRRGPAGEDLTAMQLAAHLHAAHPGSADPSPEFVDELARRLRREQEAAAAVQPQRRQFLAGLAAAAAAGVGVGFGIQRIREAVGENTTPGPIQPTHPNWVAVAKLADLTPGKIQRFSAAGVEGFVLNVNGQLQGLSAACTDQGCILDADPSNGRLVCPCHYASFRLDGAPNPNSYGYRLTPLPAIQVRATAENVEVLVPKLT